jgi:head-tail adaptor
MASGARTLRPISSGELRLVCDIEQLISEEDAAGTPMTRYQLFAKDVRFAFADYRAAENFQAKEMTGQLTTYITMRWRPGLSAQMRIKYVADSSRSPPLIEYYEIQGDPVRDATLRIAVLLQCVKRDAPGARVGTIP